MGSVPNVRNFMGLVFVGVGVASRVADGFVRRAVIEMALHPAFGEAHRHVVQLVGVPVAGLAGFQGKLPKS